jgi:Domain of unknown function (DUF4345)
MERKLLQIAVVLAGLTCVALGLTGVLFGTMHADLSGDVVLDSYVRFAKGVLLAIGLFFAPVLCLWQRHVARVAQRCAPT